MKLFSILLLMFSLSANADVGINVGFFTEHLSGDKSEYNENNKLVQLSYFDKYGWEYSVATFENSHYVRSHLVGVGQRWGRLGVGLTLVHGYEGHITSHVGNLIFMPVLSYDVHYLRFNFVGNVLNVGLQHRF